MARRNSLRFGRYLILTVLLFTCSLSAQIGTEALPDRDIGRPPRPPFITFLGIVMPGKFATDPSLPPIGPVMLTLPEEQRAHETSAGPAGEEVTSILSTWSEAGRVIKEIRKEGVSESETINRYEGTRLVSQESTFSNSRQQSNKFWNNWIYDKSGKLSEYRIGSGNQIQNHDTSFERDALGRLISYHYRQGPKDELSSRTALSYSADGRTIGITYYDAVGALIHSEIRTMDDQGRIITVVARDRNWKTKQIRLR